jgi:putative ABC transport system ATP-binding protein
MLELRGVSLVYHQGRGDEVQALRGIDLSVGKGQFVTVVGSNGAGKSSTVQVISGAARPTSGQVLLGGRNVTSWPDHKRAARVARVFDDPRVGTAPELSIEDNLALALVRGKRRTLGFALRGGRRALLRDKLARLGLGLENRMHDRVGLLSAGQRQSLTMIMAGLAAPDVLLLDEHLAALDPGTAQRVLGLTAQLAAEMDCATVMVTHNMDHALRMGDRVIVMSRGRIIRDVSGETKRALSVSGLIDLITGAGDAVTDRSLLVGLENAE